MQEFIFFFFFCKRMFPKYTLHVNVWHAPHGIHVHRNVHAHVHMYARACILSIKSLESLVCCRQRTPHVTLSRPQLHESTHAHRPRGLQQFLFFCMRTNIAFFKNFSLAHAYCRGCLQELLSLCIACIDSTRRHIVVCSLLT